MIRKRTTRAGQARYDVRLRDPAGRTYGRTFRTRADARAWEAAERHRRARGEWIDPRGASVTFAEWADQWLTSNPTKRPKSLAADEAAVRNHLVPTLGSRRLGSITPADVQRLVNGLCEGRSPRSVRRYYGTLRAILNAAVAAELIGRTPCRGIKLPQVEPTHRPQVDGAAVTAIAATIDPSYEALVHLLAETGLRIGEALGLRVGRLDLLRRRLHVVEQLQEARGHVYTGPPKSAAGNRTIALSAPLCERLGAHLATVDLTAADAAELVFQGPEGGPVRYSHWRARVWVPAVERAGYPDVRPHDLRRASATGLVASAVDLRTAQHRLGHTDPRLTLAVYAQATEGADDAAAAALAAFLAEGTGLATRAAPVAERPGQP